MQKYSLVFLQHCKKSGEHNHATMNAQMRHPRYLHSTIADDLSRKMVFLGGPRQVGKTSLLKQRFPRVDAWQVAARTTRDYVTREGVRVAPALRLLEALK